jgi:hypothetical protein
VVSGQDLLDGFGTVGNDAEDKNIASAWDSNL